ncbi:ABC transporter ATP-binding protein [Micromonospora sp. NPDC049114]|uniref:ABC transporter ATP-binding protein n=1 Tax=Micromonospora sp. NPDC049114 TaxID=3155498 RepID=UPI0033C5622A
MTQALSWGQPAPVVHARGLTKSYGGPAAVDGVDLEIWAGESVGILGPNGAGKTSLMRMLSCVSLPSAGSLRIFGLDAAKQSRDIRRRLGIVHQEDILDSELTVAENIYIYGRYFGMPRAVIRENSAELLEFAKLSDRADSRVETLSGGMKRRLSIARALVSKPEVLLLDEPTTGLDPQARHVLWDRLAMLKTRGVTLILTTHFMDEAEQLCDRILLMDRGSLRDEGAPQELVTRYASKDVVEIRASGAADVSALAELVGKIGNRMEQLPNRLLLHVDDGDLALRAVIDLGVDPRACLVRRGSLEDVFLRLSGRSLLG